MEFVDVVTPLLQRIERNCYDTYRYIERYCLINHSIHIENKIEQIVDQEWKMVIVTRPLRIMSL